MKFQLNRGVRYHMVLSLTLLEALSTNHKYEKEMTELGFMKVNGTGMGRSRIVEGIWTKDTGEYELPVQVIEVKEVV